MLFSRKKTSLTSSLKHHIRYILHFTANDCYTLAECYDGAFTETVLHVCRRDSGFFLETVSHRNNSKQTVKKQKDLTPFSSFGDFFSQLKLLCPEFSLDADRLQNDPRLMTFLSLHKFIHLLGNCETSAEQRDGNILIIEGKPHIIRNDIGPQPTTWQEIKALAQASRPSTGLWLQDLTEENWQNYAFVSRPWQQHLPGFQLVYYFCDTCNEWSMWSDFVSNTIVCNPKTHEFFLRHEVADGGESNHYPRFVGIDVPIRSEEVSRLAAAGLLKPYCAN